MTLRYSLAAITLLLIALNMFVQFQENRLVESLWMCYVSSTTLAIGLVINNRLIVNVSALWVTVGTLIWLIYALAGGETSIVSGIVHIGSSMIALIAVYYFRAGINSWIYALVWYLGIQMISRLTTPAKININVAHKIYDYWSSYFSAYWQFWLETTAGVALILWGCGRLMLMLFPEEMHSKKT